MLLTVNNIKNRKIETEDMCTHQKPKKRKKKPVMARYIASGREDACHAQHQKGVGSNIQMNKSKISILVYIFSV